jgi:hypothetical protein
MDKSLSLTEKLYLLAVHPEKGGIRMSSSNAIRHVLAGALIFELVISKNIRLDHKTIQQIDSRAKDPLHVFVLDKLAKQKNQMKISGLITRLSYSAAIVRRHVQENLVRKRLLRMEEKRFLFFRWKKPVLINRQVFFKLQDEIRKWISKDVSGEEEIMLLSLLQPLGMMKSMYPDRKKREEAKNKLKKMTVDSQVSESVSAAIAAANAVAAAVSVAALSAAAGRGR